MNSNMKRTLLLLALGAFLAVPAFAQTAGSSLTPASPPATTHTPGDRPPGGRMGGLTPEDRQELMPARQEAMQANPELAQEQKALQDKINAAMIKADPNVAPIIAKMEATRQKRQDGDGGPRGSGGDKPGGAGGDKPPKPGN